MEVVPTNLNNILFYLMFHLITIYCLCTSYESNYVIKAFSLSHKKYDLNSCNFAHSSVEK